MTIGPSSLTGLGSGWLHALGRGTVGGWMGSSQLNLRTIRSPFEGVIVDQMMWLGEISSRPVPPNTRCSSWPSSTHGECAWSCEPALGMCAAMVSEIQPNKTYTAAIASVDRIILA